MEEPSPDQPGIYVQTGSPAERTVITEFVHSAGTWRNDLPNIPHSTQEMGAACVNGKIYSIQRTYFDIYDIEARQWTSKDVPSTCTPGGRACVTLGPLIYIANYQALCVYDTEADLWSTKAKMPAKYSDLAGAAIGDIFYVIAGSVRNNNTGGNTWYRKMYAYDTRTDLWTTKPVPTGTPSENKRQATAVGTMLYYFEGSSAPKIYDTETNLWTEGTKPTRSRQWTAACSVGTNIYYVGGFKDAEETYADVLDTVSGLWTSIAPMPTGRGLCEACTNGNSVYVLGGTGDGRQLIEEYLIDGDHYPAGTLVIENGYSPYSVPLYEDKKLEIKIMVKNAYLHDGKKLSKVPAKVNSGNGWTEIV